MTRVKPPKSHPATELSELQVICSTILLTFGCTEAKEVLHGGKVGPPRFCKNPLPYNDFVGNRKSPSGEHPFLSPVMPAEIPLQVSIVFRVCVDNAPLHHIEIQRCILIFPGLVPVPIAVPSTVFFPMRPPLVAIRCNMSIQLVCTSPFFPCHNGGSRAEVV